MSRATRERAAKREKILINGMTPFVLWDRRTKYRPRGVNIAPVVAVDSHGLATRCGTLRVGANASKRRRRENARAERAAAIARRQGRDRHDRREAVRAEAAE